MMSTEAVDAALLNVAKATGKESRSRKVCKIVDNPCCRALRHNCKGNKDELYKKAQWLRCLAGNPFACL